MTSFTWRPIEYDDLPALHAMKLAVAAADDDDRVDPLADMQEQFTDPWCVAPLDTRLVLAPDGNVAAYARVEGNPDPAAEPHVFVDYEVHPEWRGQGLEESLMDWLEARGVERLQTKTAGRPRHLRAGLDDRQSARRAFMAGRGYAPVRYFYRMLRDLTTPLPEAALPAGLALRVYTPDLSGAVLTAHNDAFADHWGFEPIAETEWEQFFIRAESFRPEFTLVAFEAGQIAGYCLNRVHAADNARLGRQLAHIGSLGTRRPWRGRGLATALLVESLRRFQAAGYTGATLGVDAANPSGAVAIYERVGFAVIRRFTLVDKPVD